MRTAIVVTLAGLLVLSATPAAARQDAAGVVAAAESDVQAFRRLRAEGIAAANADDAAGAGRRLAEADARVPNHPGLILMRARLAVGTGRPDEAMTQLNRYAGVGLSVNVANDRVLSALVTHPEFDALAAVLEANRAPIGADRVTTLAELPGSVLVESAVRDEARGRWLVSQVRGRTIVALADDGTITPFLTSGEPVAGVLGMTLDERTGTLWAATAPVAPAAHGLDATAARPNALLKIDAASGRELARYPVPEGERSLGDVALAADGTVYVADSTAGEVFQLKPGATALESLFAAGTLASPQGMVVTPDGTALIVADYTSGLWRVDRTTGAAARLSGPDYASLIGIDGLTTDGTAVYGFQNGVAPQRVLKLVPDAGWSRIETVQVLAANLPILDEPTTGLVRNGELVFVSRSQWSDFGGDGAQTTAAPAPAVIARLPLH